MSKAELACVYSALILADDDVAVTGEKIQTILKAASVDIEPYWPGLFAKALEGINVKDLITNISSGVGVGGGAPAAAAGGAAPAAAAAPAGGDKKKEEKKKEESEPESDDDMGFGLFD
ncbi:unnamed protein product [Nezara viridula]|uniref:Large ribosomal subunit protein P1 n=1 Tax=Nezara viridula TaxID=85310 RepID=A0A9P0MP78_NEZVI|nr:unnamed protein product [Nezara viridula]